MENMKNMIETLKQCGLVAHSRSNTNPVIIGGTECTEHNSILMYKNSFSISCEYNDWIVHLPGQGQTVVTKRVSSLEEAVKVVCNYFKN